MVTESWVQPEDFTSLVEASPPGYSFFHKPRPLGRGGGVVAFFRNTLNMSCIDLGLFSQFPVHLPRNL